MNNTIVTACNRQYLWGVILLLASIRLNNGKCPIHIFSPDLKDHEVNILKQFEDVTVFKSTKIHPHMDKAKAILSADTDYVTWIDADCLFIGNLDSLLIPDHEGFQIRFRETIENSQVFKQHYNKGDVIGDIPENILKQWQTDVNERLSPRTNRQCVSNFISLHKKHLPFINKWDHQLNHIQVNPEHPIDKQSTAYFMTDESVLSSLLAYAYDRPNISPYKLNLYPKQYLMHFGETLKPWNTWRARHLKYYNYVVNLIGDLQRNNFSLPLLPQSLDNKFRQRTHCFSLMATSYLQLRSTLSNCLHARPLQ